MANINDVKIYFKKSGNYVKAAYYTQAIGAYISTKEAHHVLHETKSEIIVTDTGTYPEYEIDAKNNIKQHWLAALRNGELPYGDTTFLNRIIRNGGFVKTVRDLEHATN